MRKATRFSAGALAVLSVFLIGVTSDEAGAQSGQLAANAGAERDGRWSGRLARDFRARCGDQFSVKVDMETRGGSLKGTLAFEDGTADADRRGTSSTFEGDVERDGSFEIWTPFELSVASRGITTTGQMKLVGRVAGNITGTFYVYVLRGGWDCGGTFALAPTDGPAAQVAQGNAKEFARQMADDTVNRAIAEAESLAKAEHSTNPPGKPQPTRHEPQLDNVPPTIELPRSLSVTSAIAEIAGHVNDASQIVEVAVNDRPVPFDADGSFRVRRAVPPGDSTIAVTAIDEWGNKARASVRVSRPAAVAARTPAPVTSPKADPFADIHFGRYHALVIGNNAYGHLTKLKTAVSDARAVADVLAAKYGFSTAVLTNATRGQIIDALAGLRAKLTFDDNLLIYYAGHGVVDDITSQGYWLPIDAQPYSPSNWISTTDITLMVRAIRAKHILVVADSCYSGTLVRAANVHIKTAEDRRVWVKRIVTKRARTALVSGGLEPVLDSGAGNHSVFAKVFLETLEENKGVMDGQTLFEAIKRPVVVNSRQTPQYSDIRSAGHDGGDFLFVRRR